MHPDKLCACRLLGALATRLNAASLNLGSLTDWPVLGGPSIKAAGTRALLPWAVEVSELVLDGSVYRSRRHNMISALLLFQQTIQRGGLCMAGKPGLEPVWRSGPGDPDYTISARKRLGPAAAKRLLGYTVWGPF